MKKTGVYIDPCPMPHHNGNLYSKVPMHEAKKQSSEVIERYLKITKEKEIITGNIVDACANELNDIFNA
jgi:hypothetical protein